MKTIDTTLGELLKEGVTNVKIGCKYASGYFFAGELTNGTLEEAENNLVRRNQNNFKIAKKRFDDWKDNPPTLRNYINKAIRETETEILTTSLESWNAHVENYFKTLNARYRRVITTKENIENHSPIFGRAVVEIYKSISEPDCYNILIEGEDEGFCWSIDEYKKGSETK